VYFLALTTWAGDIGAYYAGSRLGRRPLVPRVSPKKTVEGALGGIAATVLIAALGSGWIWPRFPLPTAIWVGALLAVVGMLGDLSESVVKRAAGAKDSGTLIPGHGGVLDRLDSVIFGAPALYGLVWMGWV
jgi:phosphatidate cytidylyltransferase